MRLESYTMLLPGAICDRLRNISKASRIPATAIVREVLPGALDAWEAERSRALQGEAQRAEHVAAIEAERQAQSEPPRRWVGEDVVEP